jgi:hypothetical protein
MPTEVIGLSILVFHMFVGQLIVVEPFERVLAGMLLEGAYILG